MTEPEYLMKHSLRTLLTVTLTSVLIAAGCALRAADAAAGQGGAPSTPGVLEVVIVFKTHFDIGYTDMASNIVERYRTTMIDQALKVVDQNRDLPPQLQFAWTIPGWPMRKITEDWEGGAPEREQRILQAFKDGRFVVHALPFSTHTELLEPEDLVRGMVFASRISREAGLPLPRDAKMTDVPCHSWFLPTLLRNAGVEFLHLGCNAASSSPRVPPLFWWEGPDGSRLLTMYSAAGYGTGTTPPAGWPYKTWLALMHTGDNHGPPRPDEVKGLLDEARKNLPGVKIRIGRLSDFADAVLAEKAPIPVVRADMPDTWIHGPMCDPAGARLARNVRPAIAHAESLNTLLGTWGVGRPRATDTIAKAYEQSLLYGEHTWGGSLSWVTSYGTDINWGYGEKWRTEHASGRFKRLEASWAEHTAYIEKARDIITPVLEGEMETLARSVHVQGPRVVVFNPLPWKRDGVVTLAAPNALFTALKPVGGGPVASAETEAGLVRFTAHDIPAFGYRTYTPVQATPNLPALVADASTGTLENRWFKLTLDPARGAVRSLVDKRSGRELVDAASAHGFGQYLYERFDSNNVAGYVKAYVKISADWALAELGKPNLPPAAVTPYRAASPANCTVTFQRTSSSVAAVLRTAPTADLAHGVTTRIVLRADQPCVDLEVTLHDKPAEPWPEAGWLCLPFKLESPQFRLGRLGSVIDPTRDIALGANRHLFGINTGVAMFDSLGRGVGFCALDNPLVSLDTPGCWKYSQDFVPQRSTAYINLFNNQWTTNFRLWNSGTWTSRVRLWAFDHYRAEAALTTPSLEARWPLLGAATDGAPGPMPASQQGLRLSRKGLLVTAFGANPDGDGTVLRIWELAGQAGACKIQLPKGIATKSAQPCDLRGRPAGKPISVQDGSFTAQLRAFAPASYLLN